MSEKYDHKLIEKKWQKKWEEQDLYKAEDFSSKKKFYCLDMFPYPSAAGLHVGHPLGYIATDIYSRFLRMNGYNVLHPMGWDAFGLPTENYAIKINSHPKRVAENNIKNYKRQLKMFGFSYDWSREINTSDTKYYKWTQWLFLQLYKNGLAYKKKAPVNWCKDCKTVLANEQVIDGKCERCKNEVVQKDLEQWFFKITDYTERLLKDLDQIDWPEPIKLMQKNWIGRSEGSIVRWKMGNFDLILDTYTTTIDTLYGVTFMVISPEHSDLEKIVKDKYKEDIEKYIKKAAGQTKIERTAEKIEKTGVFTGSYVINPINGEKSPLWIADYVLMDYGTGVVMGVPAHDKRDYDFAKKYKLEIRQSIEDENSKSFFYDDLDKYNVKGKLVNSDKYTGMDIITSREKITKDLKKKDMGEFITDYKLRDWLISRQRYWGAPIPIIYCPKCGEIPVLEENLPVELPDDVDFKPKGESPLSFSKEFHNVKCPKCDANARREVDTMDTFVCSSWYFLRFCDPNNDKEPFSKKKVNYWMAPARHNTSALGGVDLYVGGAEHAVLHLLYSRFITKFLKDQRFIDTDEPFQKLINQGLILAEDGRKMSKSLGNVVNPDDVVEKYGADTMRMYEMFMGPLEDAKPWDTKGIVGIRRFVDRIWEVVLKVKSQKSKVQIKSKKSKSIHKAVKKLTEDIKNFRFNTAISALMIFFNGKDGKLDWRPKLNSEGEWEDVGRGLILDLEALNKFLVLLSPFAPHLAEELWEKLGNKESIFKQKWPEYDEALVKEEKIELVIQVNGKVRDKIMVDSGIIESDAKKIALESEKVKKHLGGKELKKVIFVKGKLINLVV